MAVKIRLARHGAKKSPYYRVVVADGRAPRDGRLIEEVGRFNPVSNPKMVSLDLEKIEKWMANGAQPTDAVARLIEVQKSGGFSADHAKTPSVSKKSAAKEEAAKKEAEEAAAAKKAEEAAAKEAEAAAPEAPAEDAAEEKAE